MKQLYQGDIVLLPLKEEPKGLKFSKLKEDLVVAEGEITGHRHILKVKEGRYGADLEIARDENGFYLKINSGKAELFHDKHKVQTITPTPKIWFIGQQVEYDEIKEIRRVQD